MTSDSEDDDVLLASLEASTETDPPHLTHLRASRLQALSTHLKNRSHQLALGFGTYTSLPSESDCLSLTTSTEYCVVHFCKPDFNRCRIMDTHLAVLADRHLETKFAKMEVERAPFLTERLGVRVLPCVIAFVKGVGVDRVVGFEGLGGSGDGFETGGLERRLVGMGVLREEVGGGGGGGLGGGVNRGGGGESGGGGGEEEDGDDEWD